MLRVCLAFALALVPTAMACSLQNPTTCEDLRELASNVRGLTQLDLLEVGTDGLQGQLDRIEVSWQEVLESAGAQFGSELRALESSVEGLLATLRTGTAGGAGLTEVIPRLQQEVAAVESAWHSLTEAVSEELSDCDLAGPSAN